MNEVESTTKGVFSCINNNQVLYQDQDDNAYLYLDPMTHSMLQVLYQDLQTKLRSMVAYGTAMSKETSIRYNHILAEAAQALTNIQIYLQAAEMQVDLPTTHESGGAGGSTYTPQPLEMVEQTENTDPDDLMDTGGQTLTGATTENHLGTETADEQILELTIPQDD